MDVFLVTLESISVLIGMTIIGYYLNKRGILSSNTLSLLSPLALEVSLPCLIFHTIITNFKPDETPEWWILPLWWLLFTLIALILSLTSSLVARRDIRREFTVSLFYQNAIFIPLAILTNLSSSNSTLYLVTLFIFTMFYGAFFFNTYPFFLSKRKKIDIKKIFHPVLVSTLIAIPLRLFNLHVYIPGFIKIIIDLLGRISMPLIMILIGGYIAIDLKNNKGKGFDLIEVSKFVIIKNIIFPLVFLLVLLVLHPPYHIALVFLLQAAIPPVSAIPIVVEREGGDRYIANQFLVSSFVSSIVSLPLIMMIFTMVY